ncbi:hypothetical protein LTR36_005670 [Oleoguttula mirabilis]|uniref:Uncharacterized protein n=1 Tax=Oleoguttula mirabilis TaxID=1507867 RepID=A0AAV9JDF8_9PEZI|nr:hypothetical protein LTR36_005670 [Oleoguttula mirabilis]
MAYSADEDIDMLDDGGASNVAGSVPSDDHTMTCPPPPDPTCAPSTMPYSAPPPPAQAPPQHGAMAVFAIDDFRDAICDQLPVVFQRVNFLNAIGATNGWVNIITTMTLNMRKNRTLARSVPIANITRGQWEAADHELPDAHSGVLNPPNLSWTGLLRQALQSGDKESMKTVRDATRENKYRSRATLLSSRLQRGTSQHESQMRLWLLSYVRGLTTGVTYPNGRYNDPTQRQDEGCLGCFSQLGSRSYHDMDSARLTYCKLCDDFLLERTKLTIEQLDDVWLGVIWELGSGITGLTKAPFIPPGLTPTHVNRDEADTLAQSLHYETFWMLSNSKNQGANVELRRRRWCGCTYDALFRTLFHHLVTRIRRTQVSVLDAFDFDTGRAGILHLGMEDAIVSHPVMLNMASIRDSGLSISELALRSGNGSSPHRILSLPTDLHAKPLCFSSRNRGLLPTVS